MQITSITTDPSLYELRLHGTEDFPFQYNHEDIHKFTTGKIDWHWHREFEIVRVEEGTVTCSIGNAKIYIQKGEALFINSRVIHSLEASEKGILSNILFYSDLIAPNTSVIYEKYLKYFFQSNCSHILLKEDVPWEKNALYILDTIFLQCQNAPPLEELDIHIALCKLWKELYTHRTDLVTLETSGISLRMEVRLRLMLQFISKNYAQKITLNDLANAANISKTEAVRCFHDGMMTSPIESLNHYRLNQAKRLLETTEDSVTNIAFSVGFDNCSYFNRLFKRTFHMTPGELRKFSVQYTGTHAKKIL